MKNLIIIPYYPPEDEGNNMLYGRWKGGYDFILVRVNNVFSPDYDTYNPIIILHEALHKNGLPGYINLNEIEAPHDEEEIEIMVGWLAKKFYLLL